METMNISLPEGLKRFIDEQVATGGYSSVSEYIRELVRGDQKSKAQARLESLLLEGLESGEGVEVSKEHWDSLRRKAAARLKAQGSTTGVR